MITLGIKQIVKTQLKIATISVLCKPVNLLYYLVKFDGKNVTVPGENHYNISWSIVSNHVNVHLTPPNDEEFDLYTRDGNIQMIDVSWNLSTPGLYTISVDVETVSGYNLKGSFLFEMQIPIESVDILQRSFKASSLQILEISTNPATPIDLRIS